MNATEKNFAINEMANVISMVAENILNTPNANAAWNASISMLISKYGMTTDIAAATTRIAIKMLDN